MYSVVPMSSTYTNLQNMTKRRLGNSLKRDNRGFYTKSYCTALLIKSYFINIFITLSTIKEYALSTTGESLPTVL